MSGSNSTAEWGKGDIAPATEPFFPSSYTRHHHPAKLCPSSAPWRQKPGPCCSALLASPGETSGREHEGWRSADYFWYLPSCPLKLASFRSAGLVQHLNLNTCKTLLVDSTTVNAIRCTLPKLPLPRTWRNVKSEIPSWGTFCWTSFTSLLSVGFLIWTELLLCWCSTNMYKYIHAI